ncbi:MAG: carboxymuconolactone decarboxylase family protein [Devosia sp.]
MSEDPPSIPLPEPEALRTRLEALRRGRGFLLAHHGALAAAAPDLHAAYMQMYEALTVRPRHLRPLERESVWLAILVVAREGIGTHHLKLYCDAGGTEATAQTIIAMAGAVAVGDALTFAQAHWSGFLPTLDPGAAYADALARLRGEDVPADTAELCMLAAQAARHSSGGVAHHVRAAYRAGIAEEKMVEALSYVIWPCGVNAFLDACTAWHDVMTAGEVTPSGRFRVWADMPREGAYDVSGGTDVGGFSGSASDAGERGDKS